MFVMPVCTIYNEYMRVVIFLASARKRCVGEGMCVVVMWNYVSICPCIPAHCVSQYEHHNLHQVFEPLLRNQHLRLQKAILSVYRNSIKNYCSRPFPSVSKQQPGLREYRKQSWAFRLLSPPILLCGRAQQNSQFVSESKTRKQTVNFGARVHKVI